MKQNELFESIANNTQCKLEVLFEKLGDKPITIDNLVAAVSNAELFPGTSGDEQRNIINNLAEGINAGKKDFDSMYEKNEEEREKFIPDILHERLEGMETEKRRQYLYLLIHMFYTDSHKEMDDETALSLAQMTENQLIQTVTELAVKKGEEIVTETTETEMSFAGQGSKVTRQPNSDDVENANELVASIAMYSAVKDAEQEIPVPVSAEYIGKVVGVESSKNDKIRNAFFDKVIPITLNVLAVAAIVAAVYVLLQFSGIAAVTSFLLKYVSSHGMAKIALMTLAPIAAAVFAQISGFSQSVSQRIREAVGHSTGANDNNKTNRFLDEYQLDSEEEDIEEDDEDNFVRVCI